LRRGESILYVSPIVVRFFLKYVASACLLQAAIRSYEGNDGNCLSTNRIESYYNSNPEREWERLKRHRLEFEVTFYHLRRWIGRQIRILDVGGGPGRYAIELAREGHSVILLDLSSANIELAKQKAIEHRIKLEDYIVCDATDLSQFGDETFDVVIMLGPLYHLLSTDSRLIAITEALRVLKPDGICALSFLSAYAPVHRKAREDIILTRRQRETLLRIIKTGMHVESASEPGFTDIYLICPFEISTYMSAFPLQQLSIFGAEGLTAQSEWHIYEMGESVIEEWIELAKQTSECDAALAASEHIVFIGKKLRSP
jgi:S-adenosylmethionine-dependent methyltransferase